MKRGLRIEAFRNLGFADGKPCATELVLNEEAVAGTLGGLITLIGANNAGKSNVLDALEIFNDPDELRHMQKKLYGNYSIEYTPFSPYQGKPRIVSVEDQIELRELRSVQSDDVSDLYYDESCKKPCLTLFTGMSSYTKSYAVSGKTEYSLTSPRFQVKPTKYGSVLTDKEYVLVFDDSHGTRVLAISYFVQKGAGSPLVVPRVIRYADQPIQSKSLEVDGKSIGGSAFFKALFRATGTSLDDVTAAFTLFLQKRDKNVFAPLKDAINAGLNTVAEKFNRLYRSEKAPYSFAVDFDRQGLYLTLFRNGTSLMLDKQSTGFRYFFDLFFNLLNTTALAPGDIIIMDEPANNLHVKGQRELRAFLKEFAVQNDILIIIATHSPFMIDTDNLDEIRLVVSDGTVSRIENDFTAYDSGDPDSLRPIKEAFTAENHIIVNPKETVVFVAGMDAYCYLVAFKQLFGITGITFLPVKTFGDDDAEAQTVSNALDKIRSDSFILAEPGEAVERMKGIVSDKTVLSLSDIDSRFTTFAALFADGDLPASASVFKNHITRGSVTVGDNTKANFRKVLSKLLHEAE